MDSPGPFYGQCNVSFYSAIRAQIGQSEMTQQQQESTNACEQSVLAKCWNMEKTRM